MKEGISKVKWALCSWRLFLCYFLLGAQKKCKASKLCLRRNAITANTWDSLTHYHLKEKKREVLPIMKPGMNLGIGVYGQVMAIL